MTYVQWWEASDLDLRLVISFEKACSRVDLIHTFCALLSSSTVSGLVFFCNSFLMLSMKCRTCAMTLYSLVNLLCLVISMIWDIPGSVVFCSMSEVASSVSSVVWMWWTDAGDLVSQSDSDVIQGGPWNHSCDDYSWVGVSPRVRRSATLSVIQQ